MGLLALGKLYIITVSAQTDPLPHNRLRSRLIHHSLCMEAEEGVVVGDHIAGENIDLTGTDIHTVLGHIDGIKGIGNGDPAVHHLPIFF